MIGLPESVADARAMDGRPQHELDVAELTAADAPAVFELFREVFAAAPYGFLAERSQAEFHDILSQNQLSASVGAWSKGELLAYAISGPETALPSMAKRSPLIALLAARQERVMGIRGYAVSPRAKGHRIGLSLIARRKELAKAKGLHHFVATSAIRNLSPLNASLISGAWLVGLVEDEYCENFVTYSGPLTKELETTGTKLVAVTSLESLQRHFDAGWIGTAISDYKLGRTGHLTLQKCPPLS